MPERDIIVIGASSGGIEALQELVSGFPADLPAAIFVVLHLHARSKSYLPQILSAAGRLPAVHASDDVIMATRRERRAWGAALLIGLVAKLALENAGDAFWLHATRFDVVTAAHRWGSVGGALYGIVLVMTMRYARGRA